MMEFSPVGRICNFCGCIGVEGTLFAGGLGVMMCKDCVDMFHETFQSEERTAEFRKAPPWETMDDEQLLATLPKITAAGEQVEEFLRTWVQVVRLRKLSWTDVGRAMGVTRQAAWERFSKYTR